MSFNEQSFKASDSKFTGTEALSGVLYDVMRSIETATMNLFGWKFGEVEFTQSSLISFKHGLKSVPLDILTTSVILTNADAFPTVVVNFRYHKFTNTDILVEANGPCKVRFLYGRFKGK